MMTLRIRHTRIQIERLIFKYVLIVWQHTVSANNASLDISY